MGHKLSSEIISKQLVLPLIGTNHLLFSLAEPLQNMTDGEVENVGPIFVHVLPSPSHWLAGSGQNWTNSPTLNRYAYKKLFV